MSPMEGSIPFGRYALDLESRELSSEGLRIALQEKPFRLLVAFLERPGRVIARTDLYDVLWPADLCVDREAGLNTAVRKLRSALRELSGGRDLLETVPRVGYRLVIDEPTPRPDPSAPSRSRFSTRAVTLGAVLAAAFVVLGVTTLGRNPDGAPEPMPGSSEQRARYIEARTLLSAMGGDLSRARELLRSLTGGVPEFAPAHAYLAEASARLAIRSAEQADLDEARRTARRALELDPESAVAHRVLAMIALNFDWDVGAAGALMTRARRLDPGDPVNHLAYAAYASTLGRHEEAITSIRRAVDLEPDSMSIRSDAGLFLIRAGRPREAASECEMVLRLDPESLFARDCLLTAYSSSGDVDSARSHAIRLLELTGAPDTEIEKASVAADPRRIYLSWRLEGLLARPDRSAVQIATSYLALGDKDNALTWLEEAAHERSPLLAFVPARADFVRLRNDPRYREILRTSGLDVFTAGS